MSQRLKWIHGELGKAAQELEARIKELRSAEAAYERARAIYDSWETVFRETRRKEGGGTDKEPPPRPRIKPHRTTFRDLAEHVLRERGPLPIKELVDAIGKMGRRTTPKSLSVMLNNDRPSRFRRNQKGEWYLAEQEPEE